MTKTKTKVSSSLMNDIVEYGKEFGNEVSEDFVDYLRSKGVVSNTSRSTESYKIKDGDGVYYSVGVSFTSSEKGHSINRTKEMNDLVDWFNNGKKRFLEKVTTTISNPTVVSS